MTKSSDNENSSIVRRGLSGKKTPAPAQTPKVQKQPQSALTQRNLAGTKKSEMTSEQVNADLAEQKKQAEEQKKLEAARKKQEAEREKRQTSKEEIYAMHKRRLYETVPNLLADKDGINDILQPLAEEKGKERQEDIGILDAARVGINAVGFTIDHGNDLNRLRKSKDYYQEEAEKLLDKNKAKDSFFMQVLYDKDTPEQIERIGTHAADLINEIGPTIISAGFRQAGRLEDAQEKLQSTEKELEKYPNYEKRLEELQKNENRNEKEEKEFQKLDKLNNKLSARKAAVATAQLVRGLEENGIDSSYVASQVMPIVGSSVTRMLTDSKTTMNLIDGGISFMQASNDKEYYNAAKKLAAQVPVDEIINNAGLENFLREQKNTIATAVNVAIENSEVLKRNAEAFGVSNDLVQDLVPVVLEVGASVLQDKENVTRVYNDVLDTLYKDDSKENKAPDIVTTAIGIIEKPEVSAAIGGLGEAIDAHKDQLSAVANAALETEAAQKQLEARGVSTEMAQSAVPIAIDAATAAINHREDLIALQKESQKLLQVDGEMTQEQKEATAEVSKRVGNILNDENIQKIVNQDIPAYLENNKEGIANAAWSAIQKDEKLKKTLKGVDKELIQETVNAAVPFINQVIPVATKIATEAVKDPDGISQLIEGVQKMRQAVENKQEISDETAMQTVRTFFEMQKKNPDLKNAIQRELPEIIKNNSEQLAPVIDAYLQKTEFGRALNLDTKKALDIMADKVPEVSKVVENYAKGNTVRAALGVVGIALTSPRAMSFLVKTAKRAALHKDKSKALSEAATDVSRAESSAEMQGQLQDIRKSVAGSVSKSKSEDKSNEKGVDSLQDIRKSVAGSVSKDPAAPAPNKNRDSGKDVGRS